MFCLPDVILLLKSVFIKKPFSVSYPTVPFYTLSNNPANWHFLYLCKLVKKFVHFPFSLITKNLKVSRGLNPFVIENVANKFNRPNSKSVKIESENLIVLPFYILFYFKLIKVLKVSILMLSLNMPISSISRQLNLLFLIFTNRKSIKFLIIAYLIYLI